LRIGRRAPSTIADLGVRDLPQLGMQEQEHLLTSAAVPYCDPDLNWNRAQIKEDRKRRQAEFQGPSSKSVAQTLAQKSFRGSRQIATV
jgi:hypothetical protein